VPAGKLSEENMKEIIFFASLKSLKKESDTELDLDPDPLVRVTDPRIRIRTKTGESPTLHLRRIF
jgi:hypothetical protein